MVQTGASGRIIRGLGAVAEDIIPDVDDTRDLGSSAKRWAAIYVVLALVTSLTIGGVIKLTAIDGVLFVNASTQINRSLTVLENLTVNISTLYVNSANGRVGIGTLSPGAPLHIAGNVMLDPADRLVLDGTSATTYISESVANTMRFVAGAVRFIDLTASQIIFNENGGNIDFRVEGDTNTNLFFVNAGDDRVGINTTGPQSLFNVVGESNFTKNMTVEDCIIFNSGGAICSV